MRRAALKRRWLCRIGRHEPMSHAMNIGGWYTRCVHCKEWIEVTEQMIEDAKKGRT